ncbi:MAG TPA: amidohydrolase [Candidatus Korarchaeota archaeon]|nr:amidohydrolase [Candidatus Korarchaeota archaeon]
MRSLAILHGLVVTMDRERRVIEDGGIYIEGNRIIDVSTALEIKKSYHFDEEIDAGGKVVIPGLIDSHRHLYGILTRGMPIKKAPTSFISFLEDFWWPYVEDQLDKEMIKAAAMASGVEALKNGTTCIADILEAPNAIPGALKAEAEALEKLGLRAILSFEATERISEENGELGLKENESFIRSREGDHLIRGMMCIHTTFTCSPEFLSEARRIADDLNSGIHLHLEEGAYETMYCLVNYRKLPVQLYDEIGFLKSDVLAAQCVHLRPEEMEILRRRDVKVSHEPLSNCEVGGGIAPVPDLLEMGLKVGLGTDGFIVDEFEVMRAAFLIHKGYRRDPTVMPPQVVLEMATLNNAIAVGMGERIGSIEPGKEADIAILKPKTYTKLAPDNVIAQLVGFGTGSWVDTVLVAGKILVSGGKVLKVDEEEVIGRAKEESSRLWERIKG